MNKNQKREYTNLGRKWATTRFESGNRTGSFMFHEGSSKLPGFNQMSEDEQNQALVCVCKAALDYWNELMEANIRP